MKWISDSVQPRPAIGVLALVLLVITSSGVPLPRSVRAETKVATSSSPGIAVTYTEVTQAAGLKFKQDGTGTDQKYYLETMGTGVAWLDYDQDGLMDLFFVQTAATTSTNPRSRCVALSITTTATEPLLTSPKKPVLGERGTMGREWPLAISTMMAIRIST